MGRAEARAAAANIAREAGNIVGRTGEPAPEGQEQATGDEGGEQAAATLAGGNMFDGLFAAVVYKAIPERKPTVFETGAEKGTKQYSLCDIYLDGFGGVDGALFHGFRIVKRVSADGKKVNVLCVPPQFAMGPMRNPYIDVRNAPIETKEAYQQKIEGMLEGFYGWAADRKRNGLKLHDGKAATGGGGTVTQEISDERIAELGI